MNHFVKHYLPHNYHTIFHRAVQIDGEDAKLTRYQPKAQSATQFGGEHFSVVANHLQLKGFVWLTPQLVEGELPSKDTAQAVAETFLQNYAPDLALHKEIHWIAPHDERIWIDNKALTLTGMKVKMRNPQDGRWFWVIIGKNNKPMVFERDIIWINFPGKRQSEKWLHDEWLKTQPHIPKR